jgi:magnesium transporter
MIRAWCASGDAVRTTDPAEAVRSAVQGSGMVWIDVDSEETRALEDLLGPLRVHPLAIEDMVGEINRPKVDDYGPYLYLVVHSARWGEQARPTLREIDFLAGQRYLVTYHDGDTRSIAAASEILPRRPELLSRGPAHLLHFLLDQLVDHYLPIMDKISEEIDAIEQHLFRRADRSIHLRILRLKRGMAALRRILGPQRDTVLALTRDEIDAIPAVIRPYLRDVYDRLARVTDLLDSFRDEVAGLLDLYVSVQSNRLNEVIKVLAVIATLGLPLTVITSYYGMNFDFAEYRWKYGELYVLGLLAGSLLITWWILSRRRWM